MDITDITLQIMINHGCTLEIIELIGHFPWLCWITSVLENHGESCARRQNMDPWLVSWKMTLKPVVFLRVILSDAELTASRKNQPSWAARSRNSISDEFKSQWHIVFIEINYGIVCSNSAFTANWSCPASCLSSGESGESASSLVGVLSSGILLVRGWSMPGQWRASVDFSVSPNDAE